MSASSQTARSGRACCKGSIHDWTKCGRTRANTSSSRSSSAPKLQTPMARTTPRSYRASSARHEPRQSPSASTLPWHKSPKQRGRSSERGKAARVADSPRSRGCSFEVRNSLDRSAPAQEANESVSGQGRGPVRLPSEVAHIPAARQVYRYLIRRWHAQGRPPNTTHWPLGTMEEG
eukprot:scaffold16963_cov131-Isochrysis_galbana.AAC.3